MTKKAYMKPVIEFDELDISEELLAYSVQSTGLDNDLTQDKTPGDTWDDALSRRGAWDDGEE